MAQALGSYSRARGYRLSNGAGLLLALCLLLVLPAQPLHAQAGQGRAEKPATSAVSSPKLALGQPLANALAAYRPLGINIVSSSRLVTRRHRVTQLPSPRLEHLDQIKLLLDHHNLDIEQLNAGTWYVVQRYAPVQAESPVPPRAVAELEPVIEEIVVTASYRLARNKGATHTLDATDLATLPTIGNDALRAVAHLPGVASSGVSAATRLRGGNTNELLYLIDNVELIEPFHLSEFHSLFSSVNANIVDSVEVFPGGYPASFGGKMSGLVSVDLISPQEFQGAIDVNTVVASAHLGNSHDAWSWLLSARRSTIDLALEQLENDFGEPTFHDELLRGSWQGVRQRWEFGLLNSSDAVELSDPTLEESGSSSLDYRTGWINSEFTLTDHLYGALQLTFVHRDGTTDGELDNPDLAEGNLTKGISFLSIKLANDWAWHGFEDHTLEFGWFAERQNADFSTQLTADFGPLGQVLRGVESVQRDLEVDRWGVVLGSYLLGQSRTGNFDIDWGLRFTHQRIDPSKSNTLEPRLQLSWHPGRTAPSNGESFSSATAELWSVAVDIGRYAQPQDLFQVQIDDGLVELQDPQINDQVGLSVERLGVKTRLQANLYYRRIRDPWSRFDNVYNPWVLLPELQPDRIELRASRAQAWGAELLASNLEGATVRWSLSYTWAKTLERINGRNVPRPWEQRHSVKARAWIESSKWQLGVSVIGRSGWPNTPLLTSPSALEDRLYTDQLPDFWSFDVHAARLFRLGNLQGTAYLDVSNTTNRVNVGGYTYSLGEDLGQTIGNLAGAQRRDSKLLPVFPTLGLRFSW